MRVRMVFTFDDEHRRDIAHHYGENGKATRDQIKAWIDAMVAGGLDDVGHDRNVAEADKEEA